MEDRQMPISIDDAIALFVEASRGASPLSPSYVPNARHQSYGCDLLITQVFERWWRGENGHKNPMPDFGERGASPRRVKICADRGVTRRYGRSPRAAVAAG
jgi:hypothetical protein